MTDRKNFSKKNSEGDTTKQKNTYLCIAIGKNTESNKRFGTVAQLDNASGYGPEDWGFESLRYHSSVEVSTSTLFLCIYACAKRSGIRENQSRAKRKISENQEKSVAESEKSHSQFSANQ